MLWVTFRSLHLYDLFLEYFTAVLSVLGLKMDGTTVSDFFSPNAQ